MEQLESHQLIEFEKIGLGVTELSLSALKVSLWSVPSLRMPCLHTEILKINYL